MPSALPCSRCRCVALVSLLALAFTAAPARLFAEQDLATYDAQADALLAKMTLAEKVGQMTQPELSSLGNLDDVANLFVGSVLSGGGSDPKAGNSVEAWTDVVDNCIKKSLTTRLKIPVLYGIDAVHGHGNVQGTVVFPHHIGLGCANDPKLTEEIGRITAAEVRATGIQWGFGPCVTVPQDDRWGRTYEGYSEDPAICGPLGAAEVRGMQGTVLSADPLRILACAKHYAGDGGTSAEVRKDTFHNNEDRLALDQGDSKVDEATFRRIHLAPYPASVDAGVGSIMPSYSSWNGVKMSANKHLMTDVLKDEMGFKGFLISDYNAIDQITPSYREAVKISINAGMDMVMVPKRYREFVTELTSLAESGEVPMTRIDDAVRRILRVKAAMGLLDPDRNQLADRELAAQVGSKEHRATGRQAVRESLVLLKNDGTLPITKDSVAQIFVAGRGADDVGIQCGGWTVEWQGKPGEITDGTTILEGLKEVAGDGAEIVYDADGGAADGEGAKGSDVAIVVIGEMPYAEGTGDDADLAISDADQALVKKVTDTGVPTVVVILSGRPLILGKVLDQADALVAAWLPGTEAGGIADVLLGKAQFAGKLSFTWPASVDQEPINKGDGKPGAQFAFGYGLTYEN